MLPFQDERPSFEARSGATRAHREGSKRFEGGLRDVPRGAALVSVPGGTDQLGAARPADMRTTPVCDRREIRLCMDSRDMGRGLSRAGETRAKDGPRPPIVVEAAAAFKLRYPP